MTGVQTCALPISAGDIKSAIRVSAVSKFENEGFKLVNYPSN